jgi:hypothetical protein
MRMRILLVVVLLVGLALVAGLVSAAPGTRPDGAASSSSPIKTRTDNSGATVAHTHPAPLTQPTAMVRGVTCDGLGNCWFPTWDGVAVRSADGQWTNFTTADGLAGPYCYDVAVDASGLVWIGHHLAGVSLLDYNGTLSNKADDTWLIFTPSDGLQSEWVETVEIAADGKVWFGIGTGPGGIRVLDYKGTPFYKGDDVWSGYSSEALQVDGPVDAILFDGSQVWVGADGGLSRGSGGAWEEITWPGVPGCLDCCCGDWPVGNVWDLALTDQGHVWVADGQCGAAEWDGSKWTVCDTRDSNCGLPPDVDGTDSGVSSLAVDAYDNVWFGTRQGFDEVRGVARLDGHGDWTLFNSQDDDWLKGSGDIEGIDFDLQGDGWFGGNDVYHYVVASSSHGFVLPESGGDVTSPDCLAKASFPPGAVSEDTEVTITPANSPPTGDLFGAYIFDLSAVISGTATPVTSFSEPYTLAVRYTQATKQAAIENTLSLYSWSGTEWLDEGGTLDTVSNFVTVTLSHMTCFGLLGETNRAYVPLVAKNY